jgi:predicted SAM-dependent methyltransferase
VDRNLTRSKLRFLEFLFSHRFLAIARWELHFLVVRFIGAVSLRDWRIARALQRRTPPLFLNLGSGPRGLSSQQWINIDGFNDKNVHYLVDFSRGLPFPDATFAGVFCEHVLEHFSLQDGAEMCSEVKRILVSGGCLRVVVPDAELLLKRYFDQPGSLLARRGSRGDESPMEIVNSYFRQRYEHQFLYDWETLRSMLLCAGFHDVRRASPGTADMCPDIVLDDSKYFWESLYAEART